MLKAKLTDKLTDKNIHRIKFIGMFLLTFIVTALQYFQYNDASMLSDRIGDLATPSVLAGFDWHVIIAQTNYYGFGWKWIYFILFRLFDNPYTVYMLVQFFWVVAYAFLYTLLFFKLSKEKEEYFACLFFIPVVSTLYTFHPFSSEPTLYMAVVILVLLVRNLYTYDHYIRDSIFIALWLVYMMLLHERTTIAIIALVVVLVFDFIVTRKKKIALIPFGAVLVVSWLLKNFFVKKVIASVWAGAKVKNTSAIHGNMTWFLENMYTFKIVVFGVISNFITICIKTYGVFLFMSVFCVILVFGLIFKRKVWLQFYKDNQLSILIMLFSFVSVMGTIVGMCIQSCRSASLGNAYGYKFYIYVRYYLPWAIVGVLVFLINIKRVYKLISKWVFFAVAFVHLFMGLAFLKYVFPVLVQKNLLSNNLEKGVDFRFYLMGNFAKVTKGDYDNILISIIFGFMCLLFLSIDYKHLKEIGLAFILFLSVFNSTTRFNISLPTYGNSEDAFYQAIACIDDNYDISKNIYCTTGVERRVFTLQYMLFDHTLNNSLPKQNDPDNTIVLTWSKYDEYSQTLADNGYNYITIAPAHYLWCKDSELLSDIETLLDQNGALKPYIQIEFADEETVNESEV